MYVDYRKASLVIDSHVSEGVLIRISDGFFVHIFRFDEGKSGDHVGNDGYIAKRYHINGEWTETTTVYNSNQYDDRNIHGGVTRDGRIVIFFRKFDVTNSSTIGCYFIYSDNNGEDWTKPETTDLDDKRIIFSTGQMFYNPEIKRYCMIGQDNDSVEIRMSVRGDKWTERKVVTESNAYKLSEVAGAYCGNSTMIIIERDDERTKGHPLIQMVSIDNGESWSEPTQTNMPTLTMFGTAPQIIYDDKINKLIAMTSDRKSGYDDGERKDEKLYIFSAIPSDIINNSTNWTLEDSFRRPKADSTTTFYGYPTIAKKDENEYFVVYTDRTLESGGIEQADLYQFALSTKMLTTISGMKERVTRYEEEGEFKSDRIVRLLQIHLTSVSHYEDQGLVDKAVKHMKGFKQLIEHMKENDFMSEKTYKALKDDADFLLRRWQ